MAGEARLIGLGEIDLADRGGGLLLLEAERARGQIERRPAERDHARGHHDDLLRARPAGGQIFRQRSEPGEPDAALGIDQQRGADLDHAARRDGTPGLTINPSSTTAR